MQYYSDELIELAKTDSIVAGCIEQYPDDPIEGMHEMVVRLSACHRVTVDTYKRVFEIMK